MKQPGEQSPVYVAAAHGADDVEAVYAKIAKRIILFLGLLYIVA